MTWSPVEVMASSGLHITLLLLCKDMRSVTNIAISATSSKMTATWNNLACVDHYIMKLRKVGPVHSSEHGTAKIYHSNIFK